MEAVDAPEAPSCRACWEAESPIGAADALAQPCACTGTQAYIHLSCLHRWQLQRLHLEQDASSCDVCHQRYNVPAAAWQAATGAGVVPAGERQQLERRKKWRPAFKVVTGAARLAFGWLVVQTLGWLWIKALSSVLFTALDVVHKEWAILMVEPGYLSAEAAQLLPPLWQRLAGSLSITACYFSLMLWRQRKDMGSWAAVRRGLTWRCLQVAVVLGVVLAAAALLRSMCSTGWHAAKADDVLSTTDMLAEVALLLTRAVFSWYISVLNCIPRVMLLGLECCIRLWPAASHLLVGAGGQMGYLVRADGLLEALTSCNTDEGQACGTALLVRTALQHHPAALHALLAVLEASASTLERIAAWLGIS